MSSVKLDLCHPTRQYARKTHLCARIHSGSRTEFLFSSRATVAVSVEQEEYDGDLQLKYLYLPYSNCLHGGMTVFDR